MKPRQRERNTIPEKRGEPPKSRRLRQPSTEILDDQEYGSFGAKIVESTAAQHRRLHREDPKGNLLHMLQRGANDDKCQSSSTS